MFSWRLKIREARQALKAGRPEEAGKILRRESVRDFLPAKRLSEEVAAELVCRAEQLLNQGNSRAGWSDLEEAAHLGGCDERIADLRKSHAQRGLERVRSLLIRGETKLAAEQIARLEQRRLGGDDRRAWKLIVHLIARAKEFSDSGKATSAMEMLQRAEKLLPDPGDELGAMFASRQAELEQQAIEVRRLAGRLHETMTREAWTEVLTTAEALLELAPTHGAALQARKRAWEMVGMKATRSPAPHINRPDNQPPRSLRSTHAWTSSAKVDTRAMPHKTGKRWITWIDGVGGYLICLGDEVLLGQPTGSGGAEIPILADLSRRHASIRREGEAYVITPIHKVRIDGSELSGPQVLKSDSIIELGESVRLRFHKPHALSGTAVLTLESHHKTDPALDAIVLMSESCVLGARPQSHIQCRDWTDDLVLFRRGDDLQFRTSARVEVDGEPTAATGNIADKTRIEGERFTLSFEEV